MNSVKDAVQLLGNWSVYSEMTRTDQRLSLIDERTLASSTGSGASKILGCFSFGMLMDSDPACRK